MGDAKGDDDDIVTSSDDGSDGFISSECHTKVAGACATDNIVIKEEALTPLAIKEERHHKHNSIYKGNNGNNDASDDKTRFMGSYIDAAKHVAAVTEENRKDADHNIKEEDLDEEWFVWASLPPPPDPDTENRKLISPQAEQTELEPPSPQKPRLVCKNFMAGLCPRGSLCNFRHDIQWQDFVPVIKESDLSPFCLQLMELIVPKKKIVMALASKEEGLISKLIGLYVAKHTEIGLNYGNPALRLMHIDRVVQCFSPYGPLQTTYGLTLSIEENEKTEIVAKLGEIVDPDQEIVPFLVNEYEREMKRLGVQQPSEETINRLKQQIKMIVN